MFEDPTLIITLISLGVTAMFMLGVPVFLVIGFWVIGCTLVLPQDLYMNNIGTALSDIFTDGFALLAMPLFILTGDLINRSGIAKRLSDYAYACLGWLRGGLGMATLAACGLFAAISGSNSATTATIGSMLHPEMVKGGYDERFSAATAAAGGTVGIIIPPSIIFIVYGFLMNLPISDLFVAGIIPGALMVIAMMATCWLICTLNGWGQLIPLSFMNVVRTGIGAWLGFAAIFLVLWGIYTGKFSPTEAAGVTVGFTILVGLVTLPLYYLFRSRFAVAIFAILAAFAMAWMWRVATNGNLPGEGLGMQYLIFGVGVIGMLAVGLIVLGLIFLPFYFYFGLHKNRPEPTKTGILEMLTVEGFRLTEVPDITLRSAQITGILAPLIAISVVMQQVLSALGAQEFIGGFVTSMGGKWAVLLTAMAIVYVAGMVLESLPVTIILAPILAPIAHSVGIDPIHFAVIFLVGASIGFITPPYGLNLYVASGVTGVPYFRLLRFTFPYLFALIAVWFLVAATPQLALLLLPNA